MIRAITGLPGEGKTCFAVQHVILAELMRGDRRIYSNIEWHDDEIEAFCLNEGYEVDTQRLKLLTDDKISKFWDWVSDDSLIVLDEVAEHFNSQAWKDIGPVAGTWARQHRKLGHEAYLVVQDLSHIFKQFRDLIAEEIKVTNLSNRKVLGFRLPKFFMSRWVWRDSKGVSRSKLYRFNVGVFKCYNTLATIGGVLERDSVPVDKSKETKKTVQIRKRWGIFGWLGNNWFALGSATVILALISFVFILPQCAMSDIKTTKNGENNETVADDSGGSGFKLVDVGKGPETGADSSNLGRYDSPSKRSP